MKNTLISILLVAIIVLPFNSSEGSSLQGPENLLTYCSAHGANTYYEYIDYVSIGTIARASGAETGGYFDGTALSTDVLAGSSYTLTYSHANPWGGYVENWKVYIDWNADGDFVDAGELVLTSIAYTAINYTAPVNVPLSAVAGSTRMRVIMGFYPITGPCGTLVEGEVEDYTLNIVGGSSCSESYEPNNTKAKAKSIALDVDMLSQISTATDIDWFSFSNSLAAPNINVTLTTLPANYNMKLFSPSGVNIATSAKKGTNNESIIYNTAVSGTYTIKIYPVASASSATECYTLHAAISNLPYKMETEVGKAIMSDLILYPVPASGSVTISISSNSEGNCQVNIFNLQGEKVYFGFQQINEGTNQFSLDISKLNNGMYFIQLINGDVVLRKGFEVVK
ncbi:MAG: GEVED domain-containing protein [Chitinophagales bacterium]